MFNLTMRGWVFLPRYCESCWTQRVHRSNAVENHSLKKLHAHIEVNQAHPDVPMQSKIKVLDCWRWPIETTSAEIRSTVEEETKKYARQRKPEV